MPRAIAADVEAGIGWYRSREDGHLFTGPAVPCARWLRRRKIDHVGNAPYGDGGSWIEPLEELIIYAKDEGDDELVQFLEETLKQTKINIRDTGKDHEQERLDKEQAEKSQAAMMAAQVELVTQKVAEKQAVGRA